ncbi:TonB-dependent siderophore receptor [Achromobacter aloeverae]|uniref:TonB-dependent siderophore receptor n=1 Tax=Achromobacter aloeverae TaxID=1750518 RepID=A0A4Q1HEY0_9BURK|nr:TonB-dependent siderophore receptor [Achromobacter aloeverae]RXN85142.1 TonB-dependent siderophore receptor [Achromobacter aloeverae]
MFSSPVSRPPRIAPRRPLALALALACNGLVGAPAMLLATAAEAQTTAQPASPAPGQRAVAPGPTVRIQLPALPLREALLRFGQQAGITIIGTADLGKDHSAPALDGQYRIDEGLDRLLAGSGLRARPNANGEGYRLEPLPPSSDSVAALPPVAVTADGMREIGTLSFDSRAGTKTDTPLVETPQSISVVNREMMDMLGATNSADALRYSAGVNIGGYGVDSRVDEISVRGFRTGSFANNLYLDGLRPPGSSSGATASATQFDGYGLERVEVLRGPSSVLYGQIAPGGLINVVSKHPTDHARGEVGVATDNNGLARFNGDVSGPLDEDGKWLYRVVGTAYHSNTQVDHVDLNRVMIAPSLTWRPSWRTQLTLLANYQQDRGGSTYQFLPAHGTYYSTQYGKFGSNRFLGEPGFNRYDRTQSSLGYEFSHAFSDSVKFNQKLRYMRVDTDNAGVNRSGDLLSDGRTLPRTASSNEIRSEGFTMDNNVQYDFDLGPTRNTLLTGVDYRTQTIRVASASGKAGTLDVFDPVYGGPVTMGKMTPSRRADSNQTGLYAQDQLRWGRWVATFGLRHDWSEDNSLVRATGVKTRYTDEATTWRTGLVYLFDNGFAPYVSYATSFEPVNGVGYGGTPFKPTKGKQVEAGIKFQPTGSRSMVTLSAYEIRQQNIQTPDPDPTHLCDGSQCYVQTGEARVRGLELEGNAVLTDQWTLIASGTLMDSRVTKSNSTDLGNQLPRVPKRTVNLWLDYKLPNDILPGVSVGAGMRHTSGVYGDTANQYHMAAVTLWDAAIRYDLSALNPALKGLRFSLNATNLTDKEYLASCSGVSSCYYGARRSVTANLNYAW